MLQSDDRFKHYSCCIRWIPKSPQFQNNLLNSFDRAKFLHQSSFLGLVSIEHVLHSTRNISLPNSIPRKILSPNETVSVSLSATSIKVLLLAVWISYWLKLHFSMWDGELEVLFDFVSRPLLLSSAFLMLARTWTFLQMVTSCVADECNSIILLISSFISILT